MGWLGIAFAKVFPPSFHLLLCFMSFTTSIAVQSVSIENPLK